MDFKLDTQFKPRGDQGQAIEKLTRGIKNGEEHQVLHGVTGSGKTFTMANVIEKINRPTLVISHNKMLAWQLYQEFKDFFPDNAINYFVSYYDYYQPEAYLPQTDTYISKDASVNKKIDKLRHSAVQDLLTRPDTLVVASVSCIYNLGSPETFQQVSMDIRKGQTFKRKGLLSALVGLGYSRNDFAPEAGQFRAKGNRVEIHPPTGEEPVTVELDKDNIGAILLKKGEKNSVKIWPANFWITPENKLKIAVNNIRAELQDRLNELKKENTPEARVRAYRLEQKTNYDLELIEEMGYCPGIENYSRHLDFRGPDEAPFTLMEYFPKDYLTVIDESHMTIPQIRGMYAGDRARKKTLVEHGFRLPSAIDNRPLNFEEFEQRVGQSVYMSATPGDYELEKSGDENVAEQIVRPTGLLDPVVEVRPTEEQMNDAMAEIEKRIENNQRVLVVTLTKRLAEDIAEYMEEEGLKVNYIHSDVHTLERPVYMKKLREGTYDVLVGINLLREGLDFPEVSLVVIFDADKEGFLRNETTLLQTIGRAARHVEGRAILYADKMTDSIKKTLKETKRRRKIQMEYNKKHGITPETIKKKIAEMPEELFATDEDEDKDMAPYKKMAKAELEKEMKKAAKELDFEKAAKLRDEIKKLEN
ncbi:MAG: excinuclease ABC subunit UvrB [Candidatus Spechtbacterales bacterium]|nr:excinuclease ABC subunit UvrB [Candidatus Spechtbacterales bacterium]